MGGRPRATAGHGEGAHAGARCAGRRAPPDAARGTGEAVPLRRPEWASAPGRPLRRPPATRRLPLLLRARRRRLAREGLPGLLIRRRPGCPPCPSQRARHDARVRFACAAAGDRAPEGADGLGDPLVHDHGRLRRRLRRRRVARHQRVPARWGQNLPHVLRQQPRRRGDGEHLGVPRPDRARTPGGVGGLARGLPPDPAVPGVAPPRRVRRRGVSGHTLRIERTFQAPAQAVFDAWTSEEVMRRWWHAERDWETTEAEVDLRVGGTVRVVMRDPHKDVEYGGGGGYTEIDPPHRLAFTWLWDGNPRRMLIEVDFVERDGATTVHFTHSGLWDEEAVRSHEDGWRKCFDNLERLLAEGVAG